MGLKGDWPFATFAATLGFSLVLLYDIKVSSVVSSEAYELEATQIVGMTEIKTNLKPEHEMTSDPTVIVGDSTIGNTSGTSSTYKPIPEKMSILDEPLPIRSTAATASLWYLSMQAILETLTIINKPTFGRFLLYFIRRIMDTWMFMHVDSVCCKLPSLTLLMLALSSWMTMLPWVPWQWVFGLTSWGVSIGVLYSLPLTSSASGVLLSLLLSLMYIN